MLDSKRGLLYIVAFKSDLQDDVKSHYIFEYRGGDHSTFEHVLCRSVHMLFFGQEGYQISRQGVGTGDAGLFIDTIAH